jgi:VWFA-related protein
VAAAACLIAPPIAAAQATDRYVYVSVVGGDGAPVAGLGAEHFAVREDGRDRTVVSVEPLRTPMHLAVLVDTSVGNGMPIDSYRSAIADFVGAMAATHQVALYAFGNRASTVVEFTQDGPRLRSAVSTMFSQSQGGSYLIDAIDLAVRDLSRVESKRPAILAITSETADASRRTAGAAIKDLIKHAIAFHAVSLSSATGAGTASRVSSDIPSSSQRMGGLIAAGEGDRERTRVLQQGTSVTGGSLQRVTNTLTIAAALGRVSAEMTGSYRLTFAGPAADRALKDLQVGVMLEGVTLRATPAPGSKR